MKSILLGVIAGFAISNVGQGAISQLPTKSLSIRVVYGERITEYKIDNAISKLVLSARSDGELVSSRTLKGKDANYIFSRMGDVHPPQSKDKCPRSYVVTTVTETKITKEIRTCLFGRDPAAADIRSVINLLSTLGAFKG